VPLLREVGSATLLLSIYLGTAFEVLHTQKVSRDIKGFFL